MSTFSGLGSALSALAAQQRGIDVAGQNIANVNTAGYSRQQVVLESVGPPANPAIWSPYNGIGGGVDVATIQRVSDFLLQGRSQTEHGQSGYLTTRQVAMGTVETSFNEPSDSGVQASLADLWASWHDVANNPGDTAVRGVALASAQTVVDGLHSAASGLSAQWTANRSTVDTMVRSDNDTAASVAALNVTIMRNTQAGLPTNELLDQRDQMILSLSDSVGATARTGADGSVDVFVGGTAIVSGSTARTLQVSGGSNLASAATDPIVLTWNGATYPASVTGGQLAAVVETANVIVPTYLAKLDAVAANLASKVNAVQAGGYDQAGAAGGPMFSGTTAASLTLAISDPSKLAASAVAPTTDPVTGLPVPNLDGSNADAMASLATDTTGPDSMYRTLVAGLGADAASSTQRASVQKLTTTSVDSARQAQSAVNLDEEMVNLTMYQHAYEGASRVINSVDSMLDTLINRTGLVGR